MPAYVKTIGVPQIVNHSPVADIDRVLTDALRAEFQARGKYVVQPDATGDAVLTITVTNVTARPVTFTDNRQVTQNEVTVTLSGEFKDAHDGKAIWSNPSLQFRETYPVTTSNTANDPNAFFRQDASALDRLSKEFAKKVVSEIFQAF